MKGKMKKGSFARKISKSLDFPYDSLCGSFRLEMHGDAEVLVSGCKKILEYDHTRIRLELKGRGMVICGEGLECMTYLDGTVEIKGTITDIKLGEERLG